MKIERAQDIARDAMIFLAERPDDLGALLSESGLDASAFRGNADNADFLGFVLDFVLAEEKRARDFCQSDNYSAEILAHARAALPGGDNPHWT